MRWKVVQIVNKYFFLYNFIIIIYHKGKEKNKSELSPSPFLCRESLDGKEKIPDELISEKTLHRKKLLITRGG